MKTINKDTLDILELTSDRLLCQYTAFQALHEIIGAQANSLELSVDAKEGLSFMCKLLANQATETLVSFDNCLRDMKKREESHE